MLGPFATASRRTPIHQVSLLSHVAHRLRIDVHDNDDDNNNDNDNAWQRGPLRPHRMGPKIQQQNVAALTVAQKSIRHYISFCYFCRKSLSSTLSTSPYLDELRAAWINMRPHDVDVGRGGWEGELSAHHRRYTMLIHRVDRKDGRRRAGTVAIGLMHPSFVALAIFAACQLPGVFISRRRPLQLCRYSIVNFITPRATR